MYNDGFNYYPYQNYQPFSNRAPRSGGLANLFRRNRPAMASVGGMKPKFNWGDFLSNAQKTLNVVNQAIPIFYQVKPIWNNAKTMFKIVGALNDDDKETKLNNKINNLSHNSTSSTNNNTKIYDDNQPQFFV